MNMIEFVLTHWGFLPLAILLFLAAKRLIGMPTKKQVDLVRKWLLWIITQAEIELGSKTGKLKLSMVYGQFVERFPALSKIISFDQFAKLVDQGLGELYEMFDADGEAMCDGCSRCGFSEEDA
jgi:hypothetical protein